MDTLPGVVSVRVFCRTWLSSPACRLGSRSVLEIVDEDAGRPEYRDPLRGDGGGMRDRVGAVDMRHPLLPELPPQRAGEEAVRD